MAVLFYVIVVFVGIAKRIKVTTLLAA